MTRGRRGVALAEVAVALVIVVVGWSALIALQQRMVRTGVDARIRDEARWLLQAIADSIEVAGTADASGRREAGWGWVQWGPDYGGVSLQAWSSRDSVIAELWTAPGARR
jgi:Tfp pilus assembly protein PilV